MDIVFFNSFFLRLVESWVVSLDFNLVFIRYYVIAFKKEKYENIKYKDKLLGTMCKYEKL